MNPLDPWGFSEMRLREELDAALAAARKCGEEMATMTRERDEALARVAELEEEVRLWKCLDFESPAEATKEWNVMDARILELERDLAAARADLRNTQAENNDNVRKCADATSAAAALRARCEALTEGLWDAIRELENHKRTDTGYGDTAVLNVLDDLRALLAAPAPEVKT